jgi:hypothetical protein
MLANFSNWPSPTKKQHAHPPGKKEKAPTSKQNAQRDAADAQGPQQRAKPDKREEQQEEDGDEEDTDSGDEDAPASISDEKSTLKKKARKKKGKSTASVDLRGDLVQQALYIQKMPRKEKKEMAGLLGLISKASERWGNGKDKAERGLIEQTSRDNRNVEKVAKQKATDIILQDQEDGYNRPLQCCYNLDGELGTCKETFTMTFKHRLAELDRDPARARKMCDTHRGVLKMARNAPGFKDKKRDRSSSPSGSDTGGSGSESE